MQMLARHKKDAGSNLICWKVGKSFIILENISWLFTIVPGQFHVSKYSWLCRPREIVYKALSALASMQLCKVNQLVPRTQWPHCMWGEEVALNCF